MNWWQPPKLTMDVVLDAYLDGQYVLAQAWYPLVGALQGSPELTRADLERCALVAAAYASHSTWQRENVAAMDYYEYLTRFGGIKLH